MVKVNLPGSNMTSSGRGGLLIAGGVIGGLGLVIPGLYGVQYSPPAGSAYAGTSLTSLPGFSSSFSNADFAVYNAFGGPVDFTPTQVAVLALLVIGFLVVRFKIDVPKAERTARSLGTVAGAAVHTPLVLKLSAIGTAVLVVGNFIWAFRFNRTPPAITQKFVTDLGGGSSAAGASHYLSGSLGAGSLLLFFGLLIGFAGAFPRIGCSLLLLIATAFVVLLIVQ